MFYLPNVCCCAFCLRFWTAQPLRRPGFWAKKGWCSCDCWDASCCRAGIIFMEALVLRYAQYVAENIFGMEDPMLELGRTRRFRGEFSHSGLENSSGMQACQQASSPPSPPGLECVGEGVGVESMQEMFSSGEVPESDAGTGRVFDATEFEIHCKQSGDGLVGRKGLRKRDAAREFAGFPERQELVSGFRTWCVNLCVVVLIAVTAAQAIFLNAAEKKRGHDSSCLVTNGWSWVLWIACGFVSMCLCTWNLYELVCNRRKACSCCEEMKLSRSLAEDADRRAQRAQKSKQQFMAYVFHNIRVPFNAILLGLGYLRALGDGEASSGDGKENMDLVKLMLDCAETMTNVLDDITDLGQAQDGAMQLHMEEFDLLAVVKFLTMGLKDLLYHKQIRLKLDIEPMVESLLTAHHVIGDKHRVLQTLGIFLSNAVKFTPVGGSLELEVKCEEVMESALLDLELQPCSQPAMSYHGLQWASVSGFDAGKHKVAKVALSVKDFPTGLSFQDQSTSFEPYSLTNPEPGVSGLGLSMAKRFAERVGGYIGRKSKEGEDNAFCLSIPYCLVPVQRYLENDKQTKDVCKPDATDCKPVCIIQDDLSSSAYIDSRIHRGRNGNLKSSFQSPGPASRRRVLLVEDTEINRIILRKVLQNLNLHCEEAENGKVAVDYFKQGRTYDLVLMDKEMPIMDGHEATRQLRMMGVKTPIIALTGNALQSDKDLFFEAGVDDFQTKPLSRDKLVQLLARYGVESSCADNRRG